MNVCANVLRADVLNGLIDNLVGSMPGTVQYSGPLPSGSAERLWDRAVARYFEGEVSADQLRIAAEGAWSEGARPYGLDRAEHCALRANVYAVDPRYLRV